MLNQQVLRRHAEAKLNFIFPSSPQSSPVMASTQASSALAHTNTLLFLSKRYKCCKITQHETE